MFEAVHGSAPDIAGRNLANPMALIQSAVLMTRYLGEDEVGDRIDAALMHVLGVEGMRTRDLGGQATTTQFTEAIVRAIESGAAGPG